MTVEVTKEICGWVVLRVVYAWLFFLPIPGLLKDWAGSKRMVASLLPCCPALAAVAMVGAMLVGGVSILLGVYAQLGGIILCVYSLMGYRVHKGLARDVAHLALSKKAASGDVAVLASAESLGVVGHVTSAQKNIVLAAVGFFFVMLGSGPLSLIPHLLY